MKETAFVFILFIYLTSCRFANTGNLRDYESDTIVSPTSKYFFITSVNRTDNSKENFADVFIHLYNSKGQLLLDFNTNAGDANKWAAGWDKTQDTIILFSSDIGNSAYRIENGLIEINLTSELDNRAKELKQEKYKE